MQGALARGTEESSLPRRTVSPLIRANARRLRRSMTGAEARLWAALRGHRFAGTSFRRQTPIGPYIADFCCPEVRLVIEVDGGQHGDDGGIARDLHRDAWLADAGFRVIRFWNHEVLAETDTVLDVIWFALDAVGAIRGEAEPPLPGPPPRGGRGRQRRGPAPMTVADPVATHLPGPVNSTSTDDAAASVPSPLEGKGPGGGAAASPPSAAAPSRVTLSSASKTGRHP
ncbi:endonuclease domain-containing protein [Pinisolibacter sp.]|uniref:endonuclease domain-containing protein n=1 Tax=Pinisolibacter sp. TaxID=2172024 RepID=UPI002FDE8AA7